MNLINKLKDTLRMVFARLMAAKGRRCPELQVSTPVLILAPHPDDEVFGCGGLIARLVRESRPVEVVICSGGGGSHRGCCNISEDTLIRERRKLTLNAAEELGLQKDKVHFLDFTDGSISESDAENMSRLKDIISSAQPQAILVPHHGEGWSDHLAVRRIGFDLAPQGCRVYEYCVWMWFYRQHNLDWSNAFSLKLTLDEYAQKLAAIDEYVSPCAPCGKPYSGVLPRPFLDANSTPLELFFRIK